MLSGINHRTKQLKTMIFDAIHTYMDTIVWDEVSGLLISEKEDRLKEVKSSIQDVLQPPSPWKKLSSLIADYEEEFFRSRLKKYSDFLFPGTGQFIRNSARADEITHALESKYEMRVVDHSELDKISKIIAEYEGPLSIFKKDNNGNYICYDRDLTIYEHDLPSIRDLKAVFNILIAVERATEHYPLMPLSVVKTVELLQYKKDIQRNFAVYMATNSILTHHIEFAKAYFFRKMWPKLYGNLLRLIELCNAENLQVISEFVVENIILIELYQQNYLLSQQKKLKDITAGDKKDDKKHDTNDSFFTTLAVKGSTYLELFEREEYKKLLGIDKWWNLLSQPSGSAANAESKLSAGSGNVVAASSGNASAAGPAAATTASLACAPTAGPGPAVTADSASVPAAVGGLGFNSIDHSPSASLNQQASLEVNFEYRPEKAEDKVTIKELKKLLNGLIAFKKVLDDWESYSKASVLDFDVRNTKAAWVVTLGWHLTEAYNFFSSFDYKAIFADQSRPLANLIKEKLKILNGSLQKLACLVDELEWDQCLKENTLLKHVQTLIQQYNQMTRELKIPVDYVAQKRVFYSARLVYRNQCVLTIEKQLRQLTEILKHRHQSLIRFPADLLTLLQQFIVEHEDSICIDRDNLEKYKIYLADVTKVKAGVMASLEGMYEHIQHRLGVSLHNQMMHSLHCRHLYLEKQKRILHDKIKRAEDEFKANPYDFIRTSDVQPRDQKFILLALNSRVEQLSKEKQDLFKSSFFSEKAGASKFPESKERTANQAAIIAKEISVFRSALTQFSQDQNYATFKKTIKAEFKMIANAEDKDDFEKDILSPDSIVLLDEIETVLCSPHYVIC